MKIIDVLKNITSTMSPMGNVVTTANIILNVGKPNELLGIGKAATSASQVIQDTLEFIGPFGLVFIFVILIFIFRNQIAWIFGCN